MNKTGSLLVKKAHRFLQGLDQRNRDAASPPAFAHDFGHVKQLDLATADDGLGSGLGDQADAGLRACQ